MTEPTNPEPLLPDAEPLVDTTPATPERTAVTYGILLFVLAALITYFLVHSLRR